MECIILVGLPGCGKSSFYRERFAESHDHVSKDVMRNARRPQRRQEQRIAESLAAGRSVVVDNTHPRARDRASTIALARAYDAEVVGYVFECSVADALRRNRAREGRDRVPDVAIYTVRKRLEPPMYEEGFDRLYAVTLHEGERRFEIRDVPRG